ncbi:twin-arginine translocation signal domain-containing protein [Paractinoplanes hotanensis]|uniref:Twin-arginine translocation signal domain-containing protein n=1 Tax=Paractinoplanes hotanensis TaxID=2906497 RepID=A0ABT0YG16_9ACTN|nr:twin-arginine translocation signal domain-containing protein [Actinoplanes hotanensis]MCM4085003.1 twin-arginine translocation signal domain-containing protein [Actinoplanes hotanensis]
MDRRSLLRGAAVVGAAGVTGLAVPGAAHAAGPAGMPTYRYLRDALTLPLRYNPTGEFIFPCIRGVYDKISGARGRYYLYYAPHEKPGGICVAWANSLNGPFTEHTGNPIIDNVLPGGGTVSHVSSPHVTWNATTRQFLLYWHGENKTTRVARSSDGINFRDETPILSTRLVPGLTETSYARVFAHNGRYVMVYMGVLAGKRRIYHGWSPNGWDQWQFAQTPLVNPEPDGLTDISGPSLVFRNNTTYVAYHGNDGRMRITEVGNALDRENHLGVFYSPAATDNGRAAAPSFGTDGGVEYMFYEAGPRLNARICIARAT